MSARPVSSSKHNRDIISRRVKSISPSGIRKFFDIISTMEGAISLGVGEPDFTTPWHISEAGIYSLEKGYTMYTSNKGLLELRQELARHLNAHYQLEYDPETELLITVGVSEGLDLAMRSIINPNDEVLSPDPSYVSCGPCTTLAGGIFVPVPTSVKHDFKVEAADMEKRVTARTKAVLLGYPNNPTGAVMERDELARLAEVACKHDLIVVSDEIYERLVYGVQHTCCPSLPGMKERTILLGGFSKAYAMTGWRIGYAAGPADMMVGLLRIHQYTIMTAPTTAQ